MTPNLQLSHPPAVPFGMRASTPFKFLSLCAASVALLFPLVSNARQENESSTSQPDQQEERRNRLSPEEYAARVQQFLERFPESDANKDGELSREEIRAFNQKRRGEPSGGRPEAMAPTHADVAYGEHEQQRFDIWLAESKDGKPTPLCIYIHGGGFRGGDKKVNAGTPESYLREGISFASMNYRLTDGGKYPYPIPMQDAARGLQFIRSKSKEWNLDPERVACYGGSAGAGISLWLGFHDDLADPDAEDPVARLSTRIVAAATQNGQSTYDLRTFREWFGVPDLVAHDALIDFYGIKSGADWESERVQALMTDASAITHLTKDDVPVYMVYGRGDDPVDANTSQGTWVHHVRLGLKLQEVMQDLGMECVVVSPDHQEGDPYGSLPEFMIQNLKAAE